MSEIKHIGAMTIGIIGTGLTDRNEKIKEILESPTPYIYDSDFGKYLKDNLILNSPKEHINNDQGNGN